MSERREFLAALIEERQVGHWSHRSIYNDLLSEGHTTHTEIGEQFGWSGFRQFSNQIAKRIEKDSGLDANLPTPDGNWVQRSFASIEERAFAYHRRKQHANATMAKAELLRQETLELFDVDLEDLPAVAVYEGTENDEEV